MPKERDQPGREDATWLPARRGNAERDDAGVARGRLTGLDAGAAS